MSGVLFYAALTVGLAFGVAALFVGAQVPRHRLSGTSGWKYLMRSREVENAAGRRLRNRSDLLWWLMVGCFAVAAATKWLVT